MNRSPAAILLVSLLVLLGLSIGLLGCTQPAPRLHAQSTRPLDGLQTWIKQHAIVLKTTDPTASLDDLAPLQQVVGTASIVGLGEDTHGSHEFFAMKQRLLEFLVEKMGFTLFAMEGSWSAGETINQYVLNGQGEAANVLQQFHFWTWNTQEVLALLQWMRAYDADPSHTQKVAFAGFDCQVIEPNTYDAVIAYLQAVDPPSVPRVMAWYQGLRPDPTMSMTQYTTAYMQLPQSTRQQYVQDAQQVYHLLQAHQTPYTSLSSPQAFAHALQEARVIVQGAQLLSYDQSQQAQASSDRDAFMAENIAWLHEQSQGGAKMVLWAHDYHIASDSYHDTMGQHLRDRYQSQYLAIGTSFYEGFFNARGMDAQGHLTPVQPFYIQASQASSNYELGTLGLPLYALDLRHISAGPVSDWMIGYPPFLEIGAVYTPASAPSDYAPTDLLQWFDVMISIQHVTASHVLPLQD
jgi:erythromycin esterase